VTSITLIINKNKTEKFKNENWAYEYLKINKLHNQKKLTGKGVKVIQVFHLSRRSMLKRG